MRLVWVKPNFLKWIMGTRIRYNAEGLDLFKDDLFQKREGEGDDSRQEEDDGKGGDNLCPSCVCVNVSVRDQTTIEREALCSIFLWTFVSLFLSGNKS